MLSAEQLAGRGLEMLKRLQRAYYVEGQPISERHVILQAADKLGFDAGSFAEAFDHNLGEPLEAHLEDSRRLLAAIGAQGVPALALCIDDTLRIVPANRYFGRPERFVADIRAILEKAHVGTR